MRRGLLALSCSVVLAAPAWAQSNVEVNAGLQFDFQSPGARSLAMGSAFIGAADDATAAFVNPAGLRALSRKEVSFEGRVRDFTIPVVARGRLDGNVTGLGVDTLPVLRIDDQSQDGGGLSFLSFVYPRSRWAVAGYRHELAHFTTNVRTEGFFFANPTDPSTNTRRQPIDANLDLRIAGYGVTGSFNVTSQVSVGASVALYDFHLESRTDRFSTINARGGNFTNPPFYGQADYSTGNIANFQLQQGDNTDVGFNVGVVWAPSRMFQVGSVFRQGPDFDLTVDSTDLTPNPAPEQHRAGKFHVPHVFGVGVAFRPKTNFTIVVDSSRIDYSRLTEDFVDIFSLPENADPFAVRDGTEFHAGLEYVFTKRVPIAVRTGYWFDPEHPLEARSTEAADKDDRAIFRIRHEDQQHFTLGAGAVFGRFEVNGGGDISQRATTVSISAVVRF